MENSLRDLFLEKGLTEDQIEAIQADGELQSISDLAAGATSAEDARAWAEELGLSGRVAKSRFIQSWTESKMRDAVIQAASAPAAPAEEEVRFGESAVLVSRPRDEEEEEAIEEEDWSWVKVAPPVETRIALSYIDGEPVSRPGGVSDLLRSSLRSNGLTSVEVSLLEQNLEPRSCKALAVAAATKEGAARLARGAGIHSRVSQENFTKCWHEAAAAMIALDAGSSKATARPLAELVEAGDFEACTDELMKRATVNKKKDLLPLLRGMLGHLAEKDRLADSSGQGAKKANKKVLPALASLYGEEVAAKAAEEAEKEKAEWRCSWTLKALFTPRIALALQSEVLSSYQDPGFQAACESLSRNWDARSSALRLEQKMRAVEELCMERALSGILPNFGFTADAHGMSEMKETVGRFTKTDPEVRRKQMEITTAVMKKFKL